MFVALVVASVSAFAPVPTTLASSVLARTAAPESSPVVLEACRRNTKKEKRQRNKENMRQFKKGDGKKVMGKKAPSRKKLALKAASAHEKEREAEFMTRLFQHTEAREISQEEAKRFAGIGNF